MRVSEVRGSLRPSSVRSARYRIRFHEITEMVGWEFELKMGWGGLKGLHVFRALSKTPNESIESVLLTTQPKTYLERPRPLQI